MFSDLKKSIVMLDDWQTILCCRGLVLLIDRKMALNPESGRPGGLSVTDFNQWVQLGGRPVRSLVAALCERRLAVTAGTGRQLLRAALDWGFHHEVRAACRLAYAPVDHLGTLAPVTIMAALLTVMRWHPAGPPMEALLCPQPGGYPDSSSPGERRYPWFQTTATKRERTIIEQMIVID